MAVGGVNPIGAVPAVAGIGRAEASQPAGAAGGFGDLVLKGLEQVSQAEMQADDLVQRIASGQAVEPHEVMIASSKAALSVELAVAVRDKALEAYREIMGLQL